MNESPSYVSLPILATALQATQTRLRTFLREQGVVVRKRLLDGLPVEVASVTASEAALAKELWGDRNTRFRLVNSGFFYVIQLIPEFDPMRIKLGFSADTSQRLRQHQASAPTARIVKVWPCNRLLEKAAIDFITAKGCSLIRAEVWVCDDLQAVIARGDEFFGVMEAAV
jgi:hypothetical protein